MITTCELCGKSFETSQKRNLCEACSVAAEQRIYHPTHGVCCICGRTMPDARRGQKYCSPKCKRLSRSIINLRWHDNHPEYKPAPKIKKPKTRSFMTEVEDLGRKMGIGGYGQMMAMIKTRCQKSGLSVRSKFCHLKFVYEKEHGHD